MTAGASTLVWVVESSSGRGRGVSCVQAFHDATHSYDILELVLWFGTWRFELGEARKMRVASTPFYGSF
jgi:hypothetical protein